MVKSFHILFFIFSFGVIFMPNETEACGAKKTFKVNTCELPSSCKKQEKTLANHEKIVGNFCCNKFTICKSSSEKSNHNCNGHCNHNSCKCAALSFSINLPQSINLKLNSYISISKNTIIPHNENRLPSGFHSIWLPPVIS